MASILVVEDEPTVLVLGESVLQRAGYETLTAGTLAEAQAVIHSDQKLDLVFTDITLPENPEGGLQMGQLVRQARPGVPALHQWSSPYRRHERAFCKTQFVFTEAVYRRTTHQCGGRPFAR